MYFFKGRVVINGLYTTDANNFTYKRPVKSIALEPNFSKKSSRQFVSGGTAEQLILSGKGIYIYIIGIKRMIKIFKYFRKGN